MTDNINFDQGLTENLRLSSSIASVIVLVGQRQFDRFVTVNQDGSPTISSLEGVIWSALAPLASLWVYEPATELPVLSKLASECQLQGELPVRQGIDAKPVKKGALLPAFLAMTQSEQKPLRMALLVNAGLLLEDPAHPRDDEHGLLSALEHFARSVSPKEKLLLLRAPTVSSIPPALLASPGVRIVNLAAPSRDERMKYLQIRCQRLAAQCAMEPDLLARLMVNASDDWLLTDLEKLLHSFQQQQLTSPAQLESTMRAYRLGISRTPWADTELYQVIKSAQHRLSLRVRGQSAAISAVQTALRKACAGLTGAHQSGWSRGPRATFFLAGPTGTGKTEAAKSVAELLFGDESALIRFDCAEFKADHSVARLIGAPPGYVGYDSGGELTERVRSRPHSVILFDEIEKASPRLLDVFLSVLDDGRLTNGQGLTADFSECVLIFTSNLGIYNESVGENGRIVRRPRFGYETPYEEIQRSVREAIQEEFVSNLGRPELLGRLGGEKSLIVFDYLRDLTGVAQKFINNIASTTKRLHDIELDVDPKVIEFIAAETAARPDVLVFGARGMAQVLDDHFTNPLADFIFDEQAKNGHVSATLLGDTVQFTVVTALEDPGMA